MRTSYTEPQDSSIRVVINHRHLVEAIQSAIRTGNGYLLNSVRRRHTADALELIISGPWQVLDAMPQGTEFAPLADHVVIEVGAFEANTADPIRLLSQIAPGKSNLVVAAVLDTNELERFPASIAHDGRVFEPSSILFVGPGLVDLPELDSSVKTASDPDNGDWQSTRDSRTAGALGNNLFGRLKRLSIALVGTGRGGHCLVQALNSVGACHDVVMIDGDVLAWENMDGMPALRVEDLGQLKTRLLGDLVIQNRPEARVRVIDRSVNSSTARRVLWENRFDAVFSFADNNVARLQVSRLCQATQTLHVDIGTLIRRESGVRVMSADIRLLEPGNRGCIACVPPMADLEDVLYELAGPDDALSRGPAHAWHEQRLGSLFHLNSLAASVAVETFLGWLAGDGSVPNSRWIRLRWPAGGVPEFRSLDIHEADPSCRFCRDRPSASDST